MGIPSAAGRSIHSPTSRDVMLEWRLLLLFTRVQTDRIFLVFNDLTCVV